MKNIRILATLFAVLVLAATASAQSKEQLVDVVATGHGSTVREATKAALRSAVEAVVGTMVDATTLVQNDELIENEVLSYSAGMIASVKTIGEPKKSADGLYTVKVKASVKKGRIEEKLRAASVVNVALDGADLFARMTAAKDNLSDAEAMIKSVLSKHISCIVAEAVPGKNGKSPIDFDPKTGEVFANVRVRIDQAKYTQFANEVIEMIGPMANKKIKLCGKGRDGRKGGDDRYKPDGYVEFSFEYKDYPLFVMTSFKSGSAVAYSLDKNIFSSIVSCLDTGSIAVEVTLHDIQGGVIAQSHKALSKNRNKDHWGDCSYVSIFGYDNKNSDSVRNAFIMPFYDTDEPIDYNMWSGREGYSSGEFQLSLGTFAPEELKSVGKLEIKVGHMKRNQFSD